jgi:hypothetical protein
VESGMIKAQDILPVGIGFLTAAVVVVAIGAFLIARMHRIITSGTGREKALFIGRTYLPTRASHSRETNSLPTRTG